MFRLFFKQGLDISRHQLQGVYSCTIGKHRSKSSDPPAEVICSLHEGVDTSEEWDRPEEGAMVKLGPITLSYQGANVTLRPWDPYFCVIAAGIHNRLIHFPIQPGSRVFALGCSLQTLSHMADIVGPSGHLIGIIDENHPKQPTPEEISAFSRRHARVSCICADVQNATLERYQRLLSLPQSSKYALLMATHPRLGENSPARVLAGDAERICTRIFEFLECDDASKVKCLVICHWPPSTKVEAIRDVVLSHVDVLQKWKRIGVPAGAAAGELSGATGGAASSDEDEDGKEDNETDDPKKNKKKKSKESKKEKEDSVPHHILLDLPLDNIITEEDNNTPHDGGGDANHKLTAVVDCLKRLSSGLRTGLFAKEQLLLRPYFPNHALLMMKYAASRDERKRKVAKKVKAPPPPGGAPPGMEAPDAEAKPESPTERQPSTSTKKAKPPSSSSIPVPSFLGAAGAFSPPGGFSEPPGLPPGLAPPDEVPPPQPPQGAAPPFPKAKAKTKAKAKQAGKGDQHAMANAGGRQQMHNNPNAHNPTSAERQFGGANMNGYGPMNPDAQLDSLRGIWGGNPGQGQGAPPPPGLWGGAQGMGGQGGWGGGGYPQDGGMGQPGFAGANPWAGAGANPWAAAYGGGAAAPPTGGFGAPQGPPPRGLAGGGGQNPNIWGGQQGMPMQGQHAYSQQNQGGPMPNVFDMQ